MTEFELMTLFSEQYGHAIQLVFGFVSILSAFLIMSYFAANKLNIWLVVIVLVLFSVVCFLLIAQINLTRNLMQQINEARALLENTSFGGPESPIWTTPIITTLYNFVTFGGYIGCMVFFYYQRKHGSDEDGT